MYRFVGSGGPTPTRHPFVLPVASAHETKCLFSIIYTAGRKIQAKKTRRSGLGGVCAATCGG